MQDEDELSTLEPEVAEEPEVKDDQEPEAPETKDEDDEKQEFSRRVNKRIDKLVYERNAARDQNSKLLQRIEALERARQEEDEARAKKSFETRKQEAMQRKIDAKEIGDYQAEAEADKELFSVLAEEKAQKPKQEQTQQPAQPQRTAYDDWHEANQWVYDPKEKQRYQVANNLFHELLNEGYDANDPDLYAELDTRMAKANKRTQPPPTGAPDRGQAVGGKGKAFTAEDKQRMRDWGLDPDNEAHRKEWIKNKG